MPVMDGYTATAHIRACEKLTGAAPTSILALTAHALSEESHKIIEAGCDMRLAKTIRKKILLQAIYERVGAQQEGEHLVVESSEMKFVGRMVAPSARVKKSACGVRRRQDRPPHGLAVG